MKPSDLARLVLRAGPLIESYRKNRTGGRATPLVLSFLVTTRCTLRCRHCFYHHTSIDRREELSAREYDRLSTSLGPFAVGLFCGGEPFVRDDLATIVNTFRRNNRLPLAGASTNGQLTDSILDQTERILRYDRSSLFNLSVSLDGFREQHDHIRGAGTFDRAVRTYRELARLAARHPNLVLSITTAVSTLNQHVTPRFLRWVKRELDPSSTNVLLVRQSPRDGEELKAVDPRLYRQAQDTAMENLGGRSLSIMGRPHAVLLSAMADRVHRTMLTNQRCFHCHAGTHGVVIDPRGDVNPCEVLTEQPSSPSMGNLRNFHMDFAALYGSRRALETRRLVNRHEACRACTHETMGYLPSMLFAPNSLGHLFGLPGLREHARPSRPPTCADLAEALT